MGKPVRNTAEKTPKKPVAKKTVAKTATATPKAPVSKSAPVSTATNAAKARATAIKSATQAAPKPTVVSTDSSVSDMETTPLEMKKKELIDSVVVRSGIKKKDAKPVIEAMLAVLGETIAEGRELNLQPLGKLKINRVKLVAQDRIVICKLRQSGRARAATSTASEKQIETPLAGTNE